MARPLDDVDRRIIDQLQEEGRRPYTEIARAVGISEASVRQRVASLTERGVIQIVAATSPIALGMIQSFISVRLTGGGLERAAGQIAAIPEVDYVAVCTGPHRPPRRRRLPRQRAPARGHERDPRDRWRLRDRHRGDPLRAQGLLPLVGRLAVRGRARRLATEPGNAPRSSAQQGAGTLLCEPASPGTLTSPS